MSASYGVRKKETAIRYDPDTSTAHAHYRTHVTYVAWHYESVSVFVKGWVVLAINASISIVRAAGAGAVFANLLHTGRRTAVSSPLARVHTPA